MSENAQAAKSGDAGASIVNDKAKDIRQTNIIAAKGKYTENLTNSLLTYPVISIAVADVVRTSLGPRGMDKMVSLETSSHYWRALILQIAHYFTSVSNLSSKIRSKPPRARSSSPTMVPLSSSKWRSSTPPPEW